MPKVHGIRTPGLNSLSKNLLPCRIQNFRSHIIRIHMRIVAGNNMLASKMKLDEINADIFRLLSPLPGKPSRIQHQQETQSVPDHPHRSDNNHSSRICRRSGGSVATNRKFRGSQNDFVNPLPWWTASLCHTESTGNSSLAIIVAAEQDDAIVMHMLRVMHLAV